MTYDKKEVREALTIDNIYELLTIFGGEPEYTSFGIVSSTICHNMPGEGSRKLYFYTNTGLCHCYTGCEEPSFDIFELVIKVKKIQNNLDFDLNDAVVFVALYFGIAGSVSTDELSGLALTQKDWEIFNNYERITSIEPKDYSIDLKSYDKDILDKFNYSVKLTPWINDGIGEEALKNNVIGFYPGGN